MDANYLDSVKDSQLPKILIKEEVHSLLEKKLEMEIEKFKPIQKLKEENKLDFGDTVDENNLENLFPKIKREVDDFLQIDNINIPKYNFFDESKRNFIASPKVTLTVGYVLSSFVMIWPIIETIKNPKLVLAAIPFTLFGGVLLGVTTLLKKMIAAPKYMPDQQKIIFQKHEKKIKLTNTASYLYATHVLNEKGFEDRDNYFGFHEGFARGVQRKIANSLAEKEKNKAYLHYPLEVAISGMKSSYLWISKKLNKPVKEELINIKTSEDKMEKIHQFLFRCPSEFALGNTLFSLYELESDSKIYKAILEDIHKYQD